MATPPAQDQSRSPRFVATASRNFPAWLSEQRCSFVFTTYQTGKVFFIGLNPERTLSVHERTLERVMGLCTTPDASTIYLSTIYQMWRFQNALEPRQQFEGYDAVYVPRESRVTGDIDVHDMAIEEDGRLVFVNTLFNCLATLDDSFSFRPFWKPKWISKLVPEDRCHLNGLALRDGRARYVTSVSRSDVADGWRDRRSGSGLVVDVQSGEVICEA